MNKRSPCGIDLRQGDFMRCYDIFWNSKKVGLAQIQQKGLYSLICCRCSFDTPAIYRITIRGQMHDVYLGVCVPVGDAFVLEKSIPSKHLEDDSLRFCVESEENSGREKIQIDPLHTVIPISQLHKMQFISTFGNKYLVIN